jgi:hypothetical protein
LFRLSYLSAWSVLGLLVAGCDAGSPSDVPHDTGAPVHLVSANVSTTQPLVAGAPIEFAFDRLLLPLSVNRQTFQFTDSSGNPPTDPSSGQTITLSPSYDPVARVVRLCGTGALTPAIYRITIASPANAGDSNGLRAIDGALLDPSPSNVVEFQVTSGPAYTGYDACSAPMQVDFCNDVLTLFSSSCSGTGCHAPGSDVLPADGLILTNGPGVLETAVNRVARGANTGSRSAPAPASRLFGVDMPVIDGTNAPGDSWLVYKLLLGAPCPSGVACDAGSVHAQRFGVSWTPLSDTERATLSGLVMGREMPFPVDAGSPLGTSPNLLTVDQMETISLWILQGASVPNCAQ